MLRHFGVSPFFGHSSTQTAVLYYSASDTSAYVVYGTTSKSGNFAVNPGYPQTLWLPSTPLRRLLKSPVEIDHPAMPKKAMALTTSAIAQNISVHCLSLTRPFLI